MEKRYQVFVSSTYEDLKEERQTVIECLLNMHYIPAGMEFFPASSEEQWNYIKRTIDDCDYYLLILGGKYGSIGSDGMGYTEKEFRYAKDSGKPIVSFLHQDITRLAGANIEMEADRREKLDSFREYAKDGRLVRFWSNKDELGMRVLESLFRLPEDFPASGWVKGDQVINEGFALKLQTENDRLRKALESDRTELPAGTEELAWGDDETNLLFQYYSLSAEVFCSDSANVSWAWIYKVVAPKFLMERLLTREEISGRLADAFLSIYPNRNDVKNLAFYQSTIDKIIIQFKAMGLVEKSRNYWVMTERGEYMIDQMVAERKNVGLRT